MQADSLVHENRKHRHNGHKSEATDLNQKQNDKLSEKAPMCKRVDNDKSGHTGRTCRGKEGIQKRSPFTLRRRNRQTQQKGSCENDQKKAECDNLRIGQSMFHQFQNNPPAEYGHRRIISSKMFHYYSTRTNACQGMVFTKVEMIDNIKKSC